MISKYPLNFPAPAHNNSMFPATTFCSLLSCHNSDGLVIAGHLQRWIQAVSRSWRDMRRHLMILIQDVHDVSISLLLITSKVTMNINNDTSYQEVVSRSRHYSLLTHRCTLQICSCLLARKSCKSFKCSFIAYQDHITINKQ